MNEISVGVITAPGLPEKILEDIMESLKELAGTSIDDGITWEIDYKSDPLASSSEYIDHIFSKAASIKENNSWDMAIAITDLPSISSKKVVLSEFDYNDKISLISMPALGVFRNKNKLKTLLTHHMDVLYDNHETEETEKVQPSFINRISEVESGEDDTYRYVIKSTVSGWFHLVTGMTYLNEPWTEYGNFKTIIGLAFATGTYISIFRTPWELSLDYSLWRFLLLMFIAVFGMVGWLIYTHNLWERTSTKNQPAYRRLYNLTTLLTLTGMTLMNYFVVSVLLTISILLFVPMGLFETWTDVDSDVKWVDYLNLIWFTASLGILAGALGSTVEKEENIRNVTYSYRQWYRYRQLEEEEKKEKEASKADEDEEYAGEKQTHDESEEGE